MKTPVSLDLWWTPEPLRRDLGRQYTTIKSQLEATGLFNDDLHSAEWDQYSGAYPTDQYPVFQLGWFPDYPDADDYTAPFYRQGPLSFLNDHFTQPADGKVIAPSEGEHELSTRAKAFPQVQHIGAQQAPTIPIWQGKQIAVQRKGVTGVESTLDPSYHLPVLADWQVLTAPSRYPSSGRHAAPGTVGKAGNGQARAAVRSAPTCWCGWCWSCRWC